MAHSLPMVLGKKMSNGIAVVLAFWLMCKAETDILRNNKTISDTFAQHPLATYIYRLEIHQDRCFYRRVLSVDKTGSGFFLTSQTKWGGLQWNHCEKVGLFARRGSQKCPLQLYRCLMLTHTVLHFASVPWSLRGIENVSDPLIKISLIFIPASKHVRSIYHITSWRSFSFIYFTFMSLLRIFGKK